MMQNSKIVALVLLCAAMTACQKKPDPSAVIPPCVSQDAAKPDTAKPVANATPAADTPEARELAQKQALLDYATMEDNYLNDPKGQWAREATATTSFGESNGNVADSNKPKNISGKPDGETWTNDQQDMGFDKIEMVYEKPVHATAVRVVIRDGVEAISKVELRDTKGAWSTVWSGISDVKPEANGSRTWFVRSFNATAQAVQAVRVTIANNMDRGYKVVDAVQLVGE